MSLEMIAENDSRKISPVFYSEEKEKEWGWATGKPFLLKNRMWHFSNSQYYKGIWMTIHSVISWRGQ